VGFWEKLLRYSCGTIRRLALAIFASQDRRGEPTVASARVTNTGTREGEEVVQLYIRDMANPEGARPQEELRGFERLRLRPRESREMRFKLTDDVLGCFSRNGSWHVEPGRF
jgi:beta-glucosidase